MAMALLIAGRDAVDPVVGPEAAEALAGIGISRIAVLGGGAVKAVVLEGWAFDPARADEAVRAVFPDGGHGVQVLREIENVTVMVAAHDRRS